MLPFASFFLIFLSAIKSCLSSLIDILQGVRIKNIQKTTQQCDKSNEYIIMLVIYEFSMRLQILERTKEIERHFFFITILDTHNL